MLIATAFALALLQQGDPLDDSIRRGDVSDVVQLLERGARPERDDASRPSYLVLAIRSHAPPVSEQLVATLLRAGAKPDAGEPPALKIASLEDETGCVRLLLDRGADPNATYSDGSTPLVAAAGESSATTMLILRAGGDPLVKWQRGERIVYPIHMALNSAIAGMLTRSADCDNLRTSDGDTPLHAAVVSSDSDHVAVLLAAGADPNLKNNDGDTPLHLLIGQGHDEEEMVAIAGTLIFGGADARILNSEGLDAAEAAAAKGLGSLSLRIKQCLALVDQREAESS